MPSRKFLTDDELAQVQQTHPEMKGDLCPTCRGKGSYSWLGNQAICDCDTQRRLNVLYSHAGIGLRYQRLGWQDLKIPEDQLAPIRKYIANAESNIASGMGLYLSGDVGCLQGEAVIQVNRGGKGFAVRLRDLVRRFNGADRRYKWDPNIPTYVQREVDGVVRLAPIVAAWESGVKTTFAVTTESGRQVRATDEHPFLTERGWLRLDELRVGDEVHVRGSQARAGRQVKPRYRLTTLPGHPYRQLTQSNMNRVPVHRLIAEARLNGMSYDEFCQAVMAEEPGLVFLDPAVWAVHHLDSDSLNNSPDNLQVLTHLAHHRLHAAEGNTNNVLFKVATEMVVSVKRYGSEETFDIEVGDDPHNFLANGFVVHNTGKTMLANLILKDLVREGHDCYFTTFSGAIEQFTSTWGDRDEKARFAKRFMLSRVLCLDDLGKEFRNRLSSSTFDHILRTRVFELRPTILTTNLHPTEISVGYGASILSLLAEQSVHVHFTGGDYRPHAHYRSISEVEAGEVRAIV